MVSSGGGLNRVPSRTLSVMVVNTYLRHIIGSVENE